MQVTYNSKITTILEKIFTDLGKEVLGENRNILMDAQRELEQIVEGEVDPLKEEISNREGNCDCSCDMCMLCSYY